MVRLIDVTSRIAPLDMVAMAAARERQDSLTKPQGSLGRLEELCITLAGITGTSRPRVPRKAVIVLAADHGVARAGVSAYPQARVVVADLGVAADIPPHSAIVRKKIGYGTRNLADGPAMTLEEAFAAITAGIGHRRRGGGQGTRPGGNRRHRRRDHRPCGGRRDRTRNGR